ncbi:bifunctional metallophosphatase/5'-nucleotidase [Sporosarcina cascadiensis]|uniref:bifunctional metallophosphatase/5'-nucleotidase n=1 Tax=Sporosarcina cascadiensis TaxID=2660747 RepID=UPI00129B4B8F|nr:bifunctional UDP-sugar hydrolase/5'-nucleotidase [Sporosarcina cascadiensis]
MREINRLPALYWLILLAVTVFLLPAAEISADSAEDSVTILFTHDLHDNYLPFEVEREQGKMTVGGYARLYSAIQEQREKDPDAILVDAGDLSMGTLFQTIYITDAPGLTMMGQMGYDAITFGNHEFDFRAEGLAGSLRAAKGSGEKLPPIVSSNMRFPKDKNGNTDAGVQTLQEAVDAYGVKEYMVIERKGIRIGILGLMGEEAAGNAPMSGVSFDDAVESAKSTVAALKKDQDVDLVIALSHSGTSLDPSRSEDEILMKKVPDIDVVISGHSHTAFEEPIIAGDSILGSAGEYGENLGVLNISQNENGKWKVNHYELRKIDDSLPSDPDISLMIEEYKQVVQENYLRDFGMEFDEVLAYSPFDFTSFSKLGFDQGEEPIGNLIGDSFIHMIQKIEGSEYEPVAAAVVPVGTIRDSFSKGDITASQVFNVNSLGIGPDGVSGYPLLDIYLTGKELKTVAEVDASITPLMNTVQLYIAGLSYTFNTNRFIFNKVTDIDLQSFDGAKEEIDDKKLYRVVGGLYSVQMLPFVNEKSFGILPVVPKNEDGTPVENFEDRIIYMNDHQEVKEWYAIANYLSSFEKIDGAAQVPDYYEKTQSRKMVEHDANVLAILKNPNGIILSAYGILLAFIGILVLIIVFVVKRRRRSLGKGTVR